MKKFKRLLFFDFETRSEENLSGKDSVGSHRYAVDETTEGLILTYAFDDEPVLLVDLTTDCIPDEVFEAVIDPNVLKIAHNAEFDSCVLHYVYGIDVTDNGFYDWFDTAYQAAYYSYPRALGNLAKMLRCKQKGSKEGILTFSIPVQKSRRKAQDEVFFRPTPAIWNTKESHPDEWGAFCEYAVDDTEILRQVYNIMHPLPQSELDKMRITFKMNFNGVPFDMKFANEILRLSKEYSDKATNEAKEKYAILNLRSTQQVKAELMRHGVYLESLNVKQRNGVEHEILELRDQCTGSAFSKIAKAHTRIMPDGRLRGEFVGNGAHTGRHSSKGVQMQNLSKIMHKVSDDLTKVENYAHLRSHMRLCVGNVPNMNVTVADLSQIEARIVAELAGCTWRNEAFRNGEDIYARSAEKLYGLPLYSVTKDMPERFNGKCAELGFGYGGGSNAILNIDPKAYHAKGKAFWDEVVYKWRLANPEITQLWRKIEKAFKDAVKNGIETVIFHKTKLSFLYDGSTMCVRLPSGRALYYRGVSLVQNTKGGVDIYYIDYSSGGESSHRIKVWGGSLLENITQALATDVLLDVMIRVDKREPDMEVIGLVHDETWYLTYENCEFKPLDILLEEMSAVISWFPTLCTKGEGFTHKRYIK